MCGFFKCGLTQSNLTNRRKEDDHIIIFFTFDTQNRLVDSSYLFMDANKEEGSSMRKGFSFYAIKPKHYYGVTQTLGATQVTKLFPMILPYTISKINLSEVLGVDCL